ncbi:hypothetical protein [Cryptosporangium phraense]|uniref:Uncharacterized protein n=1 Tax=Cryptosporangium phraense TaxID=2593070 RepID=A0A545AHB9_9ACTN|nr:hypothetical protein [Cryptosporangium phraense]TQS40660.1 hypothetical protein FL583_33590 [Cryptosporangium phraense]
MAGLLGRAGTPALTPATMGTVLGAALLVVGVATAVPARRAARTSTAVALADAARGPAGASRRVGWLIGVSSRLPVALLLALRVAGRRPRRAVLAAVSAIVLAWVTVLDNRRSSALAQALGASPGQASVGLAVLVVAAGGVIAGLTAGPGGAGRPPVRGRGAPGRIA